VERILAEKSIAFRQDQSRTQLGIKEVAASLPQGAALVAFLRSAFPPCPLRSRKGRKSLLCGRDPPREKVLGQTVDLRGSRAAANCYK
jgi:hypothetical protein